MDATERPVALQDFLSVTLETMTRLASSGEARRALAAIGRLMAQPAPCHSAGPGRQPACIWLEPALAEAASDPRLAPLIAAFRRLEPQLEWTRGSDEAGEDPGDFAQLCAETTLLGPGGLEERSDIWIGLSLLAPGTRYPDHNHSPEEVYLVLSEGDFFREGSGWFTPGPGGSFYNQPSIRHAMRSGDKPLLALWALHRPGH